MNFFGSKRDKDYWRRQANQHEKRAQQLKERLDKEMENYVEARDELRDVEDRLQGAKERLEEIDAPEPVTVEYEKEYSFAYTEHTATVRHRPHGDSDNIEKIEVTFDSMKLGDKWTKFSDYEPNLKDKRGSIGGGKKPTGSRKHTTIPTNLIISIHTHKREKKKITETETKTKTFTGDNAMGKAKDFVENRDGEARILGAEPDEDR